MVRRQFRRLRGRQKAASRNRQHDIMRRSHWMKAETRSRGSRGSRPSPVRRRSRSIERDR
jgi:hypothetical protein